MLTKVHSSYLDAARGLASIAVLFTHVGQIFLFRLIGVDHPISIFVRLLGFHSVLIFFLLSGHLITQSIIANIKRNGQFSSTQYFSSRITRIYPPLIGSIIICSIVWCIIHGLGLPGAQTYSYPGDLYTARDSFTFQFEDVIYALCMRPALLQVNGPLWSLFIEFQIYILAFAASVWFQPDRVMKIGGGLLGLLAFSFLAGHTLLLLVWILGAITTNGFLGRLCTILIVILALPFIGNAITSQPVTNLMAEPGSMPTGLVLLGFCALYSWMLFFIPCARAHPMLLATGRFSYSLYVIHFPILLLSFSLTLNWIGGSLSRTIGVLIVTVVSIFVIANRFAAFFENQRLFQNLLMEGASKRPGK